MSISPAKQSHIGASRRLPPTAAGLPLVGALPALLRRPFAFLAEARERHGDIFTIDLGLAKFVVLNHPRHTEQVMVSNVQNYYKGGGLWDSLRKVVGNGLLVSDGEFWLRQRRMMQPEFHRQRLAALASSMVAATDGGLRAWEPQIAADGSFNIQRGFSAMTMQVITRALFGQGIAPATIDTVAEQMAFVLDYLMVGSLTHSLPRWAPIPGARRFEQAIGALNEVVPQLIAGERGAAAPSDSLLAMLIQMVDADTGEGMSDAQLRDEVMTLFLAGYETTSLALSWTVAFLAQHPYVLTKLRGEVDSVLDGRAPAFADLPKLSYTRQVLYEVMRLRPPSWWLPRVAVADDVIDGYDIPAGTTVVSYTYGIHHNPGVWEEPERFNPERFASERPADRHRLAWVPFGTGQRQCIGRDFAIMEAQIILAMLLQRFELTPLPNTSIEPAFSSTLRPKRPTTVRLHRRA